ncbi:hypothetical protein RvY_08692 [Ramazzottius varieornatus]|uniref:Uncharacterized protein n=1 Tax=Ramazzottius varieornatus TaxID=947166 RepID=A0A1D1VBD9_RAMVA|nr:hypothetical protein RvY_08692 [Ramazzottius varieornatus]
MDGSSTENGLTKSTVKASRLTREEIVELRKKHISPSCTMFFKHDPLVVVRASKQFLYTEDGTEYLDCINNVAHVGHCHPKVVAAVSQQFALQCTNTRYLHPNMALCAQRIAKTMPESLSVVFFVNSGSEANDLALRLARHHTKNKDVIILDHAYHGTTISTTSISPHKFHHLKNYKSPKWVHVAPQPDAFRGMYRSPQYSDEKLGGLYAEEVAKIARKIKNEGRGVSLFLAESQQSCAGQVFLPTGFLKPVFEAVRAAGGLCLADEVQTGFGRVGNHFWAFEEQQVVPDFVTIGKCIGDGFPVAALVTTPQIARAFTEAGIEYFNTYGGNATACAAVLAVMDVLEEGKLQQHAKEVGEYFLCRLKELQKKHVAIGDVRGKGLFLGVEMVSDRDKRIPDKKTAIEVITEMCAVHKIILSVEGPEDNVIKIKPPMCFSKQDADLVVDKMDVSLAKIMSSRNVPAVKDEGMTK